MKSINAFDFFSNIYCLSLVNRVDRRAAIGNEFNQMGISKRINWFLDTKGENPSIDATKSHLRAIAHAKEGMVSTCLIFEDDATFLDGAEIRLKLATDELPSDWDMLYFGANIYGNTKMESQHLARLTKAVSLHAYALNYSMFDIIPNLDELDKKPLDLAICEQVLPFYKCYMVYPILTIQRPNYSDVLSTEVDYTQMTMDGIKNWLK